MKNKEDVNEIEIGTCKICNNSNIYIKKYGRLRGECLNCIEIDAKSFI